MQNKCNAEIPLDKDETRQTLSDSASEANPKSISRNLQNAHFGTLERMLYGCKHLQVLVVGLNTCSVPEFLLVFILKALAIIRINKSTAVIKSCYFLLLIQSLCFAGGTFEASVAQYGQLCKVKFTENNHFGCLLMSQTNRGYGRCVRVV